MRFPDLIVRAALAVAGVAAALSAPASSAVFAVPSEIIYAQDETGAVTGFGPGGRAYVSIPSPLGPRNANGQAAGLGFSSEGTLNVAIQYRTGLHNKGCTQITRFRGIGPGHVAGYKVRCDELITTYQTTFARTGEAAEAWQGEVAGGIVFLTGSKGQSFDTHDFGAIAFQPDGTLLVEETSGIRAIAPGTATSVPFPLDPAPAPREPFSIDRAGHVVLVNGTGVSFYGTTGNLLRSVPLAVAKDAFGFVASADERRLFAIRPINGNAGSDIVAYDLTNGAGPVTVVRRPTLVITSIALDF